MRLRTTVFALTFLSVLVLGAGCGGHKAPSAAPAPLAAAQASPVDLIGAWSAGESYPEGPAQVTYKFDTDGQGSYQSSIGGKGAASTFHYTLAGDTLTIQDPPTGDGFPILPEANGATPLRYRSTRTGDTLQLASLDRQGSPVHTLSRDMAAEMFGTKWSGPTPGGYATNKTTVEFASGQDMKITSETPSGTFVRDGDCKISGNTITQESTFDMSPTGNAPSVGSHAAHIYTFSMSGDTLTLNPNDGAQIVVTREIDPAAGSR